MLVEDGPTHSANFNPNVAPRILDWFQDSSKLPPALNVPLSHTVAEGRQRPDVSEAAIDTEKNRGRDTDRFRPPAGTYV